MLYLALADTMTRGRTDHVLLHAMMMCSWTSVALRVCASCGEAVALLLESGTSCRQAVTLLLQCAESCRQAVTLLLECGAAAARALPSRHTPQQALLLCPYTGSLKW
jgi:hypothetical protein